MEPPALWELWKSRSIFCGGLFQAAVEMIKKKSPKATLIHFHGSGSFHSAFRPACFFHKGTIQSLENGHPLHRVWVRRRVWTILEAQSLSGVRS
jgi:hypothetical protein